MVNGVKSRVIKDKNRLFEVEGKVSVTKVATTMIGVKVRVPEFGVSGVKIRVLEMKVGGQGMGEVGLLRLRLRL